MKAKDLNELCSFWLNASASVVEELKDEIFFATVGPHDVLYIPAGWLICETVPFGAAADDLALAENAVNLINTHLFF